MLHIGIAGLGWWGSNLVKAAKQSSEGIKVVAGTVRQPDKYRDFAKEQELQLFDQFEDMLTMSEIDAVIIATPHSQHDYHIAQAVDAGMHIFCEKPLSLSLSGAEKAYSLVESKKLTLAIGFNRRHHPAIIEIRRLIDQGKLGTPTHMEASLTLPAALNFTNDNWRSNKSEWPAGSLTPLSIHVVDHVIDFFGRIKNASARSARRGTPVDVDDTTAILLQMENGMLVVITSSVVAPVSGRIDIFGTKGRFEITGHTYDELTVTTSDESPTTLSFLDYTLDGNALTDELDAFARSISGAAEYPVPKDQVLHCCAVVEAIIQSAETGATIEIDALT